MKNEAFPARSEPVIDADAHVVEPVDIGLRYVDEPSRDLVSRIPGFENEDLEDMSFARKAFESLNR